MLSKFFLFTSLAYLFDASLRIIFINFLQNFHHVTLPLPLSFPNPEYNKMTNITPNAWQQISASNFTNFYSQPFNSSPGKKGGRAGKIRETSVHHRHPVARITERWNDQADTFWSLHCYVRPTLPFRFG